VVLRFLLQRPPPEPSRRLIRSVTTREPEWTEQDRAEALALTLYRSTLCPGGCGQPLDESTAHYEVGPEYEAKSTTCRACAERHESQRAKAERSPNGEGRLWYVVKSRG
jgi:hypothetical protein